jgi:hypothetical protein
MDCPRAWAFEKIAGRIKPESPKMAFGKAVHKVLEEFVGQGIEIPRTPEGRVAAQAVVPGWIPGPMLDEVMVEKEIRGELPGFPEGVDLLGYIDVLDTRALEVQVIDYKSTGDLRWALDEAELRTDPQALLYVLWAVTQGATSVRCRWIYLAASNPKKGPREPKGVKVAEAVFEPGPALMSALSPIFDAIREMAAHRCASTNPLEVPGDASACGKYGGCPHREVCPIARDPVLAVVAAIEQDMRVQARKSLTVLSESDKTGNNKERDMGLLDELVSDTKTEASAKGNGKAKQAAPVGDLLATLQQLGDAKGVNPPEAKAAKGGLLADLVTDETKEETKAEPAKKKGTLAKIADAVGLGEAKPATKPAIQSELVALLDCAYEKNQTAMAGVMTLAEVLRDAGAGRDDAPAALDRWLSQNKVTGVIVADTKTPLGCECADVLRLHAAVVIRGTR